MGKVLSRILLKNELIKLKRQKKRIVFANGCFDVIHVGHVRYLSGAKKKGDVLVVGINSDSSVRKLKGKNRPIVSSKDRANILACMEMVDYVTIFPEQTAESLIKIVKPDVHAKGTDYNKNNVPEKHLLNKYIGEIAIVGGKKQNSTRDIIKRIGNRELGIES